MSELKFCQNHKNLIFGPFLEHFRPLWPKGAFLQKSSFVTFLTLWLISRKKSEKTDEPILRSCVANEKTDEQSQIHRAIPLNVSNNGGFFVSGFV